MSQKLKLIARLLRCPKDFSWSELVTLLTYLGYKEAEKGKTGGSRRKFIHKTAAMINLHQPHPQKILKSYAINQIIELLQEEKLI